MFAKSEPVISVRTPNRSPIRTAAAATSSCQGLRGAQVRRRVGRRDEERQRRRPRAGHVEEDDPRRLSDEPLRGLRPEERGRDHGGHVGEQEELQGLHRSRSVFPGDAREHICAAAGGAVVGDEDFERSRRERPARGFDRRGDGGLEERQKQREGDQHEQDVPLARARDERRQERRDDREAEASAPGASRPSPRRSRPSSRAGGGSRGS